MSTSANDVLSEFEQQKRIVIAHKLEQGLENQCHVSRKFFNAEFKMVIETECNEEVFPLTKAAVIAFDCKLDAMTPAQLNSVKQAMLKDLEPIIASAKRGIHQVKFLDSEALLEGVVPKPRDTL